MNRNTFVYAIIAILIAIFVGVHLSSAPAEARRTRCPVVNRVNRCDLGGWIYNGNYAGHVVRCSTCRRYYFGCHAGLRRKHAHGRPAPRPQPAPRQTPRQTPQPQAQSPSQPPSQSPSQPRQPAQPCTKPYLYFADTDVGQSTGSGLTATFITDDKNTCRVKLKVGYTNKISNPCLITSTSWNVTMSHEFTVSGQPTTSTEGDGVHRLFVYEATFTDSTSDGGSCTQKYPGRYDNGKGKPISLTVTFTGTYSGGTTTLGPETIGQDEIDGIRQEYVDMGKKVIPSRDWFVSIIGTHTVAPQDDVYNWGHYRFAIDSRTDANYAIWKQHMNKKESGLKPTVITCRYRHPYHNTYHIDGGTGKPINGARHSPHQYGYALDVRGNDKTPTQRAKMRDAAYTKDPDDEDAGARYTYISLGVGKHVHADWGPSAWVAAFSGSRIVHMPRTDSYEAKNAIPPSSSNDDDSGDSGGSGETAPAAPAAPSVSPPPTTTPTTPTTVRCGNRWRGPGRCSSGGRASSRTAHESTCGAGHTYWNCNRTAIAWHATSYTCTRSGCGQTYTKCSKGNGSCRARRPGGGTYQWHN